MNYIKLYKPLISCISIAAMTFTNASLANDISQNLRNNNQPTSESDDYLEIGLMVRINDEPTFKSKNGGSYSSLGLFINGSYSWNNLFIENYSESDHGLSLGYNAFNNDKWSLDFMATTDWGKVSFENNGRYDYDDDKLMVGGRLSGYLGENTVQFAINQDATGDHNGTTISALIGRSWQIRNWNFHGIIGAEYVSAKLNNYYVGVSEERAEYLSDFVDGISAYDAGASVNFSTELGVTYPISEDLVFRATARAVTRPDEITDSPKFPNMDSLATSFRTSISYVF